MDPELKNALDALDSLQSSWKAYRETNDARLAALEKGQGAAELETKLARIEADVAKNQKILDDAAAKINRINLGTNAGEADRAAAEAIQEFNAWARSNNQKNAFSPKNAATTDNNPSGGFFVLPELEQGLDRVAGTISVMRQLADVRSTNAGSVQILVNKGGSGGGWVGEEDPRSETSSPSVDRIDIPVRDIYANPKASQDELDDASFDVASWLEDEAGLTFGELEGAAFISGNTPKRPKGILAYDKVANANFAWGKVGYIATGTSGAFDATNPADKILDLIYALKSQYRTGAAFLAEDSVIATIRKFKNSYGYLWQPSLVAGEPSTLAGYPIHADGNMPTLAADSYSLAFGNFKRGYAIRDRKGISVLRDPYTTKGFVEFYTTKRVGGGIRNFEAIKLMKFGTS